MSEIMDYNAYNEYMGKAIKSKEGIKIMCAALDRLAGKTPEELIIEAGIADKVPIDLEKLLCYWNVSVMPINFSKLQKLQESKEFRQQIDDKGDILGAVILKGDNLCIFYKEDDTPNRQRFTIAHELAHCCIDYEKLAKAEINCRYENFSKTDRHENSINAFAGKILIPDNTLKVFYDKLLVPSADKLAMIFDVSGTVMEARLEYLKLKI